AHTTGSSVYFDGRGSNRSMPNCSLTWNSMTRPLKRRTRSPPAAGAAEIVCRAPAACPRGQVQPLDRPRANGLAVEPKHDPHVVRLSERPQARQGLIDERSAVFQVGDLNGDLGLRGPRRSPSLQPLVHFLVAEGRPSGLAALPAGGLPAHLPAKAKRTDDL